MYQQGKTNYNLYSSKACQYVRYYNHPSVPHFLLFCNSLKPLNLEFGGIKLESNCSIQGIVGKYNLLTQTKV